jgi:hypothetical protein
LFDFEKKQYISDSESKKSKAAMQFADRSSIQYISFGYYYADAMYLVDFIDKPRQELSSPSFEDKMRISKSFFPKFHSHCEEIHAQPHKMSKEARLGLKLMLLEELKAKIEETKKAIAGEKKLRDIILPRDPLECSKALKEIMNEGWTTHGWDQYAEDEKSCSLALDIMGSMTVDQRQFAIFNEALFTSMPTDCLRRSERARK